MAAIEAYSAAVIAQQYNTTMSGVSNSWSRAPSSLAIGASDVHVWKATLDATGESLAALRGVLSDDERVRADRFIRRIHGDRFTCARGMLRRLLARYLGAPPEAIGFRYDELRRPSLAPGQFPMDLRFNLSHSEDKALFAFAIGNDLGVDIEAIDDRVERDKLAERFFAAGEVAALRALPERAQREAFFLCWTRKEAFVKAHGKGIAFGLDRFEVSVGPDQPARIVHVDDGEMRTDAWALHDLLAFDGFASALVTKSDMGAPLLYEVSG